MDYRLGADSGLELIREVLKNGCDVPLILLTGQNDIEVDKQAMNAGASDYLVKGNISAGQLERSIRYSIQQAKNLREIIYLNAYLEKRVVERTMILEEAIQELEKTKNDLDIALAKERDLNELKSRFVSMASHEFRTPLATIQSSLSLVKKYSDLREIEKQDRHIKKIKSSIINLTDILDDFLSIGKLEEGKVTNAVEEFNIKTFVTEITSQMQSISKSGQKINYTHTGNETVFLDKKLLKNVLLNLTSNAIKFSAEGKAIEVNTEAKSGSIEIYVKDSGIGISEEDQKHLFERFFRGQNATNIQGTGLGLNIVTKYIELMRGAIRVSSEENVGTTFAITIPQ